MMKIVVMLIVVELISGLFQQIYYLQIEYVSVMFKPTNWELQVNILPASNELGIF